MKSKFVWNKIHIAPLGTNAMVYISNNTRNTSIPHCDEECVAGMVPHHYHLLFFTPETPGYHILRTYCLDPSSCTLSALSKTDRTLLTATNVIGKYVSIPHPSLSAQCKANHLKCICDLCATIVTYPQRRAEGTDALRMDDASPRGWTVQRHKSWAQHDAL